MDRLNIDRRLSAFRAADAFTIEVYRAAGALDRASSSRELAKELRRGAIRSGAALVAASASGRGSAGERRQLIAARAGLLESRYYIYLARRFGLLDARRYRGLVLRQDAALRELDSILGGDAKASAPSAGGGAGVGSDPVRRNA